MKVPIQLLDSAARLPEYARPDDAGMDLFSVEGVELAPGDRKAVRTGIAMAVPAGYVALVWDKSGRALRDGITTVAGVIDSGYRGEVQAILVNLGQETVAIPAGEKIAQVLIQPVVTAQLEAVESLPESERGSGGFGSTGLQ